MGSGGKLNTRRQGAIYLIGDIASSKASSCVGNKDRSEDRSAFPIHFRRDIIDLTAHVVLHLVSVLDDHDDPGDAWSESELILSDRSTHA